MKSRYFKAIALSEKMEPRILLSKYLKQFVKRWEDFPKVCGIAGWLGTKVIL